MNYHCDIRRDIYTQISQFWTSLLPGEFVISPVLYKFYFFFIRCLELKTLNLSQNLKFFLLPKAKRHQVSAVKSGGVNNHNCSLELRGGGVKIYEFLDKNTSLINLYKNDAIFTKNKDPDENLL